MDLKLSINNDRYPIVQNPVVQNSGKSSSVKKLDLSKESMEVFNAADIKTIGNLKGKVDAKVDNLETSIQKLKDAKDHETRNKIGGLIRSALTTAFLGALFFAAPIALALAIPAGPIAAIILFTIFTLGATVGALALSYYNAKRAGIDEPLEFSAALLILAPIFPIIEGFQKVAKNQENVNKLQNGIKVELEQGSKQLEEAKLLLKNSKPNQPENLQKETEKRIQAYQTVINELSDFKNSLELSNTI